MAKGNFHACHAVTAAWEGGWSDHDRDPGGATMYGVTIGTLSAWRGRKVSKAEVKALTRSEAEKIYKAWYWDKVAGDALPAGIDLMAYDFAVNSGPSRSAKYLQSCVRVRQDGAIGAQTLAAVKAADAVELIETLNSKRMAFLRGLPTWGTFGKGWSNRVSDVTFKAVAMVGHTAPSPVPGPQTPTNPETPSAGTQTNLLAILFNFLSRIFSKG